ncbi:MAG: hypothetical protein Q7R80_03330 [bacterium]|nr:hypothetical protein [bacterium]
MATNAASLGASSALVRHDPRPLLVQAIDRCLEGGTWTAVDLEQFAIDIVSMGFRYLARHQRDLRDLDAVGDATETVLMYIDDGLRMLSGHDLDVAATFLASDPKPLITAFQTGWGAWNRLRSATTETVGGIEPIHVGPPGQEIAIDPMPESFVEFGRRGLDEYTDAALLDAWRSDGSIVSRRDRLGAAVAILREQYALLKQLPFAEATRRWDGLLFSDATFDPSAVTGLAFHLGWASTLIRAVERGDFGIVVTTTELSHFLATHLRSDDEGMHVSGKALLTAERVIAPVLAHALGHPSVDAVRRALREAAGWIAVTMKEAARDGIVAQSGGWLVAWGTNTVFLAVSPEEHARALEAIIGPMGQDELVDRFEEAAAPDEREQMLESLDLARLPIGDVARLIEASPRRASHILNEAQVSQRSVRDLEALAIADITDHDAHRQIAGAIVRSSANLIRLSNDAILALVLHLPSTREAFRLLLTRTKMEPERLLRAFRHADDVNVRQEWVTLAAASPAHLTYIIGDIRETPRLVRDVLAPFHHQADLDSLAWIPPSFTVSCFLEIERAARARSRRWRKRALLSERGEPVLLDSDLRWLWPQLPAHQQDAVRAAFRKADGSGKPKRKRAKPAKRSKKTVKRSKRAKKKPVRVHRTTRH